MSAVRSINMRQKSHIHAGTAHVACRVQSAVAPMAVRRGNESASSSNKSSKIAGAFLAAALALSAPQADARVRSSLESVNRPDLLPEAPNVKVIDVAGFLTEGEERRLSSEIESLEADTGLKLRVLAQNYPNTPGLAIKDYWKIDPTTVVMVADPSLGRNLLNFNVGKDVDLEIPRNFWSRVAGKYGIKFYWQASGEGTAIINAVGAIDYCFREPESPGKCVTVQGEFGDDPSAGPYSKALFGK